MAQIIPTATTLPMVEEGSSVSQTFTAQFDTGESLVSLNITEYTENSGITVDGDTYSGTYEDVFVTGQNSLLYRSGDNFESADKWGDLPTENDVDLYRWQAPSTLQKTFSYKVVLIYMFQAEGTTSESGTTTTPDPVEMTLEQTYTQIVYGNWSKWAQLLRNYVYARD